MTLPRAVREQAERAEAAHLAYLQNTSAATSPQETQQTAGAPEPVPASAPVEAAPAPSPEPVPQPTPAPAPDSFELKYKVLEGKYRAEVPRLQREVAELKAEIDRLKAQPAATVAPAAASTVTDLTLETVTERYGEDFTAAVKAVADARVNGVKAEIDQVKEHVTKSSRAEFLRDLARAVPNFQAIDADPAFTAYLDEFDPYTGRVRREFFSEADASNDAARIALFFTDFARGKVATPPAPQPSPAAPAAPAAPAVDHLVVPDSSNSTSVPVGKKLWTRAEIARFYADARPSGNRPFGKYTPEQYRQIDNDITAAPQEGRVTG